MDSARLWMLLNDLAAKLGVEVRLEALASEEEYRVSGGLVRLGGSLVAIIDKALSPAGRASQLGQALLKTGELENIYLMPAVRDYLETLGAGQED